MKPTRSTAAAVLMLTLAGCVLPYSRVGGTAHDKLYRGTLEEIDRAVQQALLRDNFKIGSHQRSDGAASFTSTTSDGESRKILLSAPQEGLVEVSVGPAADWREAVRFHETVAEVLGVSPFRRAP